MKQSETKKSQKIPKYSCDMCEYITDNKKDYVKHIMTLKHQNETFETKVKHKNPKKSPDDKKYKCICDDVFNSRTTLWRHKKICNSDKSNEKPLKEESTNDELIMMLVKENSELKNLVLDVFQKSQLTNTICSNTINSNNTNSHNKSFNLQFFLNETCKDAMNITEFVDSIKFQLSDLENVGELGYVKGISNIIVKNLNALDITQRPVHCADKKREVLYIKDDDKWEKEDDDNKKLRKMIKRVAFRNYKQVKEFKEKYPDCNKSESKYSDKYNKIIIESMGGEGDNEKENEDKIIRNISKEVVIDKGSLLTI